jgi:hypothetical protein
VAATQDPGWFPSTPEQSRGLTPEARENLIRACTTCLTWERRPWAALRGTVAASTC